jgi:hypothetical protein
MLLTLHSYHAQLVCVRFCVLAGMQRPAPSACMTPASKQRLAPTILFVVCCLSPS